MNRPISEETIRQALPTSIGGKFFKNSIKENGVDTAVLNSVVLMNGMFDPDNEDPRSYNKLNFLYSFFNTHGQDFFFNFNGATASGDYGIFSFHTSTSWKSLNELANPLDATSALEIFKALVKLIYNYSKCDINAKKYHPLLFICKESVYFRYVENKLEIKLLPLLFDLNSQYAGLPREVFGESGDITSDLFMAAYLYLSLKYPNGEPFADDGHAQYDALAERCLSPFRQRRYSAEQLLSLLDTNASTDTTSTTKVTPVGPIVVSSVDNFYDENDQDCVEDRKPKFLFLKRLLNKIIPMENPVFETAKTVAKKTVSAEKVADLLSTQEGDDLEDDN